MLKLEAYNDTYIEVEQTNGVNQVEEVKGVEL